VRTGTLVTLALEGLAVAVFAYRALNRVSLWLDDRRFRERRIAEEVYRFEQAALGGATYEWAREPYADPSGEEVPASGGSVLSLSKRGELEPPLIRVECPDCGERKDAWVTELGELEDERDGWHSHGEDGPSFRTVVAEDD